MMGYRRTSAEDFFRVVSDSVTEISISLLDVDGLILTWPAGAEKIEGYSPQDVVGQHFSMMMSEEDQVSGEAQRSLDAASADGHNEREAWHVRPDGERYWASSLITATRDGEGNVTGFVRVVRDLSQRREAEAALERSERYFRALIENAVDAITIVNADSTVRYSSPAIEHIIGYTPEERRGRSLFEIVHPDDLEPARALFHRLWEDPEPGFAARMRARHKDGSWRTIQFRVRNLLNDPAVEGIVINWHDVTEMVRAEELVKSREHFFRSIIERSSDILLVIDADRVVRYVSPAYQMILGFPPDALLGETGMAFVHPDDRERTNAMLLALFEDNAPNASVILRGRAADGSYRTFDVRARNHLDDPVFLGIIVDARDITENVQVAEALRASEERFRKIIETAGEGIAMRNPDGHIIFANERFAEIFGYTVEEVVGKNVFDLVVPEQRGILEGSAERRRSTGKSEQLDLEFFRKDGSRISCILSASPLFDAEGRYVGALGMVTDITERKRLEEQLRQSQKIEAVGRLAGGIAHDFNNLLTAIRGHVELLLTEVDEQSALRPDIEEIRRASNRAVTLTQQLLAFSRRQVLQPRVIEIDQVVTGMETLIRRLIGEDIELIVNLKSRARIRADRGQIEQVLMNLAVNARDAMPTGGLLRIDTTLTHLHRDFVRGSAPSQENVYVKLRVTDSGIGMDQETLSHVFEPFYTTKEVGKGTGLGLATVYGIVKQSGGYIRVQSLENSGTTFEILLPQVLEDVEPRRDTVTDAADAKGETVLIAEDEDAVRSLASRILRKRGYTVLEAKDGMEALDVARKHNGPIDLLLTDVVMPVLGGRELGEQLRRARADTKVLFMSGYTGDMLMQRGLGEGTSFLEKPFTPNALATKVREALETD